VPSSTSNSERATAPLVRVATWAAAALLAATALGAYETLLAAHGIRPSVKDDPELWTVVRARANAGPRVLALCGASRIQLGFSAEEARALDPGLKIVQLAIDGTNAVASFRDLADDPDFVGTALFSVLPRSFAPAVWEDQTPWVRRREAGFSFDAAWNRALRSELQERWAFLAPEADLRTAFSRLVARGGLPDQQTVMAADRTRSADYARYDPEHLTAGRLRRDRPSLVGSPQGAGYDVWLAAVDAVDVMTRKILARGGRVVLFHDRMAREYKRIHDEAYPRTRFWDEIVRRSSAVCLHADDLPEIARLDCPDGSHIDGRDKPAFTRALLQALREKNALR
jgi:hypothetical protein